MERGVVFVDAEGAWTAVVVLCGLVDGLEANLGGSGFFASPIRLPLVVGFMLRLKLCRSWG